MEKRWHLLMVVLAGLMLFSLQLVACKKKTPTPTPTPTATPTRTAFEAWLTASMGIGSLQENYRVTIETAAKGVPQPTSVTIEGQLQLKGNNRLDELTITVGTTTQTVREYLFKDKVYVATMVNGQWVVREATPPIFFNNDDSQAEFESLYKRGALVLAAGVTTKTIAGEKCDQVELTVDLTKLSALDRKYLLYIGGLSSISSMEAYSSAIASFDVRLCLLPSGVTLESETTLKLNGDALPADGIVSSHILTTLTHYEINPVIPDSIFVLPS